MEYAKTLSGLLFNETMETILDKSQDMSPIYTKMRERWTRDLFERSPTSAYDVNENYKGTNLDMVSLLNVLAEREAVVNFPEYEPRRSGDKKDNEWIVSYKNRHGKILGLTAKKDAFSFSMKLEDQNVVDLDKNKTGKFRNFLLTDLDGNFYRGARTIEIPAYKDIVDFVDRYDVALRDYDLNRKQRNSGSKVIKFENFVQPNLWQAFFSGDYIMTKALEKRLEDEAKHYRNVAADIRERLEQRGIIESEYQEPTVIRRGWTVPKEIETLQAEVDIPELEGEYPRVKNTRDGLKEATEIANTLSYSILPRLRFNTRAIELAFYKYGNDGEINPGWSVPEIERDYQIPGKRTKWNKMTVNDDLAVRYRFWKRTEQVNPNSE